MRDFRNEHHWARNSRQSQHVHNVPKSCASNQIKFRIVLSSESTFTEVAADTLWLIGQNGETVEIHALDRKKTSGSKGEIPNKLRNWVTEICVSVVHAAMWWEIPIKIDFWQCQEALRGMQLIFVRWVTFFQKSRFGRVDRLERCPTHACGAFGILLVQPWDGSTMRHRHHALVRDTKSCQK